MNGIIEFSDVPSSIAGPAGPVLGNNTKFQAALPQTGVELSRIDVPDTLAERVIRRFFRRHIARKCGIAKLHRWEPGQVDDYESWNSLPRWVHCGVKRVRGGEYVTVKRAAAAEGFEHPYAFLSGVMVCGSVWSCPVCAAKIMERRRREVAQAMKAKHSQGLKAVLVTYTIPHYSGQCPVELLARFSEALTSLRGSRGFKRQMNESCRDGHIRTLEMTYGSNGFHPHTHELYFVRSDDDADNLRDALTELWLNACTRLRLVPARRYADFRRHAVDVIDNAQPVDYMAKTGDGDAVSGADFEMTRHDLKSGKGTVHPFVLLDRLAAGDREAGDLFMAYSEAVKGRAAVQFSRGLKREVHLVDASDEELAKAEPRPHESEILGLIHAMDWDKIADLGLIGDLMVASQFGAREGLLRWADAAGVLVVDSHEDAL